MEEQTQHLEQAQTTQVEQLRILQDLQGPEDSLTLPQIYIPTFNGDITFMQL